MKKIRSYYIIGYLFTAAAGTLFHFVYDWTGQGAVAALFFPVNESTWEHMKLVFFPADCHPKRPPVPYYPASASHIIRPAINHYSTVLLT